MFRQTLPEEIRPDYSARFLGLRESPHFRTEQLEKSSGAERVALPPTTSDELEGLVGETRFLGLDSKFSAPPKEHTAAPVKST